MMLTMLPLTGLTATDVNTDGKIDTVGVRWALPIAAGMRTL